VYVLCAVAVISIVTSAEEGGYVLLWSLSVCLSIG